MDGNTVTGILLNDNRTKYQGNSNESYDRYIAIPVKSESAGIAMSRKAESIFEKPQKYNLYSNNCNFVAQQILKAGGLNFTPTKGTAIDEKIGFEILKNIKISGIAKTLITEHILAEDFKNGTIPNGAYEIGKIKAKIMGWKYGTMKKK